MTVTVDNRTSRVVITPAGPPARIIVASRGVPGPQGPAGPQGPEGPQGPKGDTGPMDPAVYDPEAIGADAFARANHTGTQSADTITDGTTNKVFTATEQTKLAGIEEGAQVNTVDSVAGETGAISAASLRTAINVEDGADVTDATNVAAAGALMSSSAGATGLSLLGDETAADARGTLGLGTAATLNSGNASGNLKALNADGGFTIDTGANASQIFNVNPFGGLFAAARAAHVFEAEGTTLNNSPRFTVAVTRKSLGSTANGPGQSSYAAWLHSEKTDWLNTLEDGEVDTGYILVNQGRKGDAGGLLIGARKVFGTAEDTGAILSIETSASKVDTAGTTTASLQAIMGFQPGLGGLSNGVGIGFSMEPRVGNAFAAFAGTERSDLTGAPKYKWLIAGASSRAAANIFAGITGSDHANGAGRVHATGSAGSPAFADITQANNGFSFPGVNQAGIVTAGVFRLWCTSTAVRIANIPLMIGSDTVIDGNAGLRLKSYGIASIADAGHAVNTTSKVAGKMIFDSVNNRMLVAGGSAATDPWYTGNGTVAVNPS